MTTLRLETFIKAPVVRCFDVSRSISTHLDSMQHTGERVVSGRSAGLCALNDTITWEATHFGIRQRLSVIITQMDFPHFFEDRMTAGAFKSMRHEHHFFVQGNGTLMQDIFCYEVPYGIFGMVFNRLVLKRHMKTLLLKRNAAIRAIAEGNSEISPG